MRSRRGRAGSPSALGPRARAVWVDLRGVYPRAGSADALPTGLDLDREVGGGRWVGPRQRRLQWFGVVTFHVPYRDGRSDSYIADRQLIPARTLRPR